LVSKKVPIVHGWAFVKTFFKKMNGNLDSIRKNGESSLIEVKMAFYVVDISNFEFI
jgi:hypothetical protein